MGSEDYYHSDRWRVTLKRISGMRGYTYECYVGRSVDFTIKITHDMWSPNDIFYVGSLVNQMKTTGYLIKTPVAEWRMYADFQFSRTIVDHKHFNGTWHKQYHIYGTSYIAVYSSLCYIVSHDWCKKNSPLDSPLHISRLEEKPKISW